MTIDYWSRLPKWTMITAATLFISDQLRSSSKSAEFAKGILSLVPSAALQSEGGQVTLQKATFTRNVHLCYTITTNLLYGVYIYISYRHLHKLYHTKILARCLYATMLLIVLAFMFVRLVSFALNGTAALNSACLIQYNNNNSNKRPTQVRFARKMGNVTHLCFESKWATSMAFHRSKRPFPKSPVTVIPRDVQTLKQQESFWLFGHTDLGIKTYMASTLTIHAGMHKVSTAGVF